MNAIKKCLLLLMSLWLLLPAGCSLVGGPVDIPQQKRYQLTAINHKSIHRVTNDKILLVTVPKASPGYDSDKMAYVRQQYLLEYFATSRWVESPAQMLVPLMVQSLQKTQAFYAVVSPPYAGLTDLRVDSDLLTLQQDFTHTPSTLQLTMRFQLIDTASQKVVATKVITVMQPANADSPYGGVVAANLATANLLQQMSSFIVHYGSSIQPPLKR